MDSATGRRWQVVVEAISGSDPVRGFWLGEPNQSAFIKMGSVADKRGITETLKASLRAEAAALANLKEAYANPITPDAETTAKHRLAPSERRSPFKSGTLEWYRNELALAQERIQLLECECVRLQEEKRERDPVLLGVVEQPTKIAQRSRPGRGKNKPRDRTAWIKHAREAMVRNPAITIYEIAEGIKQIESRNNLEYIRKWVQENEVDLRKQAKVMAEKYAEIIKKTSSGRLGRRPLTG